MGWPDAYHTHVEFAEQHFPCSRNAPGIFTAWASPALFDWANVKIKTRAYHAELTSDPHQMSSASTLEITSRS